jgi:hypothetical protein
MERGRGKHIVSIVLCRMIYKAAVCRRLPLGDYEKIPKMLAEKTAFGDRP